MSIASDLINHVSPENFHNVVLAEESTIVVSGHYNELKDHVTLSEYFGDLERAILNLGIEPELVKAIIEDNAFIHYRRWWRNGRVAMTFTFSDGSILKYAAKHRN